MLNQTGAMVAVLMCGGKGTRMGTASLTEKPLLKLKGSTMVEHVLCALVKFGQFKRIVAVSSLNSPRTNLFLQKHYYSRLGLIDVVESDGVSYSNDLSEVVCKLKPSRVFVVSADLPLMNSKIVETIVVQNLCGAPCVSILLDKHFVEGIGIEPSIVIARGEKKYCYSGIIILDSSSVNFGFSLTEQYIVMNKKEIAVNVNTARELEIARRVLEDEN